MKEIIEESTKGKMYCYCCETLFSYQKEDVEEQRQYLDETRNAYYTLDAYLTCPKCGHIIKMI